MPDVPPNVLVIMADQMRATTSHVYGNPYCTTPGLARLVREGVQFDTAITPHPLCVPARTSFWTSRWSHAHGVRLNQDFMPLDAHHAFQTWHEAGFQTALIGKDHCFERPEHRTHFDVRCTIGHEGRIENDPPTGFSWSQPNEAIDAAHHRRRAMPQQAAAVSYAISGVDPAATSTGLVTDTTLEWLENGIDHERPFAAWISYPDPHTPYEVPREWAATIDPTSIVVPEPLHHDLPGLPERTGILIDLLGTSDASHEDVLGLIATYHAMVKFLDHGLERILATLDRLNLRERTIVVFCSDHGDFTGELGLTRKGGAFYDAMVRVPLIVSWPGHVPQGARDASPVNLIDVVPTLLHLQGIDAPSSMQGRLLPTITPATPAPHTFSEYGAGLPLMTRTDLGDLTGLRGAKASLAWREAEGRRRMVRTVDHKYVTDPMGDLDELYDLRSDPHERINLAYDPAYATLTQSLRRALDDWRVDAVERQPTHLPEATLHTPPPKGHTT